MDGGKLYRKLAKHVSAIFFSVQSIVLDRAEIGRIGRISRSVIFRIGRKMTENRKCRKIFATLLVLIFAQHGNGGFILILLQLKKRTEVSKTYLYLKEKKSNASAIKLFEWKIWKVKFISIF